MKHAASSCQIESPSADRQTGIPTAQKTNTRPEGNDHRYFPIQGVVDQKTTSGLSTIHQKLSSQPDLSS
jgi:hypothetical protein